MINSGNKASSAREGKARAEQFKHTKKPRAGRTQAIPAQLNEQFGKRTSPFLLVPPGP